MFYQTDAEKACSLFLDVKWVLYDVLGIQKKTPESGMVFEAAWGPDGATCVNHSRSFETLSEIRKECPEKFKERIDDAARCTTAQKAKQNSSDSLLFNDSMVKKLQSTSRN